MQPGGAPPPGYGQPVGYPPQQPPAGYPPQQQPVGYPPQPGPGYPPQQPPAGYPPQQPVGYPPAGQPQPGYPPQQPPAGYAPAGGQGSGYAPVAGQPAQPFYLPPGQPGGGPPPEPTGPPAEPGSGGGAAGGAGGSASPSKAAKVKGLVGKVSGFMEKTWVVVAFSLLSFVLALVSMILVIQAFNQLDNATDDVLNTVNNWKQIPVVEFSAIPSTGICPDGYDRFPLQNWPGAVAGPCMCPSTARYLGRDYSSSTGSCNSNQTAASCVTDPGIGTIQLTHLQGTMAVCVRRGGAAALTSDGKTERPSLATASSTCPTGYKRCGVGSYADGAMCQTSTEPCPITDATVQAGAASSFPEAIDLGSGMALVLTRETTVAGTTSNRPISDITSAFNSQVCKSETQGRGFDRSPETSETRHTGQCSTIDTRFEVIGSLAETSYLSKNFAEDSTWCGSTGSNDANPGISLSQCSSTDSLCRDNADVTRCNKLMRYATTASGAPWSMMRRQEIEWERDCPTTMVDVAEHESPLEDARGLQEVLVTINILTFVIVGIIVPIVVIWNNCTGDAPCCPGEGKAEKVLIKLTKNVLNIVAKICRIVPMAIALGFLGRLRDFFKDAAAVDCSDSLTDSTMDFLSTELSDIHDTNSKALIVDSILILVSLVQIAFACYKKRKEKQAAASAQPKPQTV